VACLNHQIRGRLLNSPLRAGSQLRQISKLEKPAGVNRRLHSPNVISNRGWARESMSRCPCPAAEHFSPFTMRRPTLLASQKRICAGRMAGRYRGAYARRRSRRTHHVCSDRRDEGSKPTRRARVRFLTKGKASGPPQTRARSMRQEARRHEPAPPEYRLVPTFLPSVHELTRL
jgi:hypothetical protein